MKAVIAENYGGPEVFTIQNVAIPIPKSNEILIKIGATSVTRASGMMREGKPYFGRLFTGLTKPKSKTPGTDLAGVVTAIGASVTSFQVGDKVMAETGLNYGAYAEFICLPEDDLIIHQPENISPEEATGILDGASTALAFFTDQVKIKKGDKVLINGASGGIGTAAIQLAKNFGADVTAVCSSKNKALVKDIGADKVFDYTKKEFENSSDLFDVIFDTVGTLSYAKSKRNLKENGVYMTPVLSMSILLKMLFISPFSQKKLKFDATGMRKKELQMRDLIQIGKLLTANKLKTVIDKVYSLDQVQAAHTYVDTGRKRGNVILINV